MNISCFSAPLITANDMLVIKLLNIFFVKNKIFTYILTEIFETQCGNQLL
jgi:hypothetical protein